MSDDLTFAVACQLAGGLITIGHPFQTQAVEATAHDLVAWCKGGEINGRQWSPLDQAEHLILSARLNWDGGWPEKGGTRQLRELFRELFFPRELKPLSLEQTIERGLIRPPCTHCDDGGYIGTAPNIGYCRCALGRHQERWGGQHRLDLVNAPPPPLQTRSGMGRLPTEITEDDMGQALEDDRRRREARRKAQSEEEPREAN